MQYKLGCDPEFFLKRKDGVIIPACGYFPGTKKEPYKLDKGAVQVDGLALEFNIDPVLTEDDFVLNIQTVLAQVKEMITEADLDLSPLFEPYVTFNKEIFDKVPEESKVLGCNPDYNINGAQNPMPSIMDKPFRTASGHVHIGWTDNAEMNDPNHFEDCRYISQHFYVLNLHLVCVPYGSKERNNVYKRLQYYGNTGAFRPKPYGVELRSPSNLWVESPENNRKMYQFIMKYMSNLEN